jgi:flavin reductase (DIM6/NTAB) family NADH-FMN oxidoreductase RutF
MSAPPLPPGWDDSGSRSGGGIASGHGDRSGGYRAEGLRAVRRRWACGVAIVTSSDAAGFRGATVSAFTPLSLEPPLVLICLEQTGRLAASISRAGVFAVSILGRDQTVLADRFAGFGPVPDARLTGIPHAVAANGCPIIAQALGWVACRVEAVHEGGDHLVVVGAVEESELGTDSDDPLLNYEGRYRAIEAT